MSEMGYTVGKGLPSWREGDAQTITFIVTEDCNLRCKYCYISHKASNRKMNFNVAREFVDYILSDQFGRMSAVILEFIGGEPFMEVALIDKICDYFKLRAYELNSPWAWNYRFNFSTNGVNYSSKEVQQYLKKNYGKVSVGITLDGTRKKHDLQRVFPDGSGSYDAIIKSVPLWIRQFTPETKVTFASDDLIYLKESILSLWDIGITRVAANVVNEDVWKDGDDRVYENQLKALADHVLENQMYNCDYYCTLFSDNVNHFMREDDLDRTYCGAGKMLALGPEGKKYPCLRYKDYSLNEQKEWCLGEPGELIDMEKVRPFIVAASKYQLDDECLNCPIASGCPQCQGYSYDVSESGTNFQKATHICKMYKAQVRANRYYFAKLYNRFGIRGLTPDADDRRMYFLLSDDYESYCCYQNKRGGGAVMAKDTILLGLNYCAEYFITPVFVHPQNRFDFTMKPEYEAFFIEHIVPAQFYDKAHQILREILPVFDTSNLNFITDGLSNCILNVSADKIGELADLLEKLFVKAARINVNILELVPGFDEDEYEKQLARAVELLDDYQKRGITKEFNLVTDLCYIEKPNNCRAGDRTFVLAPDGGIHTCCGFYSEGGESVGDLCEGVTRLKNARLYTIAYHPVCAVCDAYQCRNCICLNKRFTNEINVSPSFQCRKSHIEREASLKYQERVGAKRNELEPVEYRDPISNIKRLVQGINKSYYQYQK